MTGSDYLKSGNIEDEIMLRDWTLNDILNKEKTVEEIVQKLIMGMDIESKYDIVKDTYENKNSSLTVGEIISKVLRQKLSDMVSITLNKYLKSAKVKFNDEGSNKIYEEPMEELEQSSVRNEEDVKVVTLKERIRADTKQMTEEEKKRAGMI